MIVQHNITAMNSNRMLGLTTNSLAKSTEKLSSGYRINRAADDAAGLSISEKMRKQIRGLDQASTNAEDGVSAVQTAEGALTEVHSMLQRMNELAVQASNGTNSQSDRQAIQDEISQLTTEIDRVAETTKFNEIYLLKGDKSGATETDTVAAHDAGLAGKLGESADGKTTFTADALKVGSNVKIAGTEYKIVGSAKDTDYTDAKTYNDGNKTDGDKIIRGDKTYTYDAGATKWKDEAGNAQNNFTAVAGDTLIDKATGKTTTVMGDGREAHTASTMDDVKAKIKDVAANGQVKINGHAYTVGTTTKADGSAYTADDIAALVKEAADKAEADKAEQAKQEALKTKAQPVVDAIAAIGEVTLDSEEAITAARSAYEALEADVKEKVTNLSDLVIAEKDLAALKAAKKAAEDLKAQQDAAKKQEEEAKKALEEAQKAQDAKLKEQEEKLKAEKDKYGFNEKTTLKSAKVKGKKVTLKWNKVKGASGYEIYCKTGKGKWKLVKTLNKGSKASYKLKGKAGKKYTYKVRVFQKVENKVIYGQYSNTKSAKIKK